MSGAADGELAISPPLSEDAARQFLLAEHAALRAELNRRGATRYQILLAVFTLLAALSAVRFSQSAPAYPLLFAFPILQYLFAGLWAHNYRRMREIADYITREVEPRFGVRGWEGRLAEARRSRRRTVGSSATSAGAQMSVCAALAIGGEVAMRAASGADFREGGWIVPLMFAAVFALLSIHAVGSAAPPRRHSSIGP